MRLMITFNLCQSKEASLPKTLTVNMEVSSFAKVGYLRDMLVKKAESESKSRAALLFYIANKCILKITDGNDEPICNSKPLIELARPQFTSATPLLSTKATSIQLSFTAQEYQLSQDSGLHPMEGRTEGYQIPTSSYGTLSDSSPAGPAGRCDPPVVVRVTITDPEATRQRSGCCCGVQ